MTEECKELDKEFERYKHLGDLISMNQDAVKMYEGISDSLVDKHLKEIGRLEGVRTSLMAEMLEEFMALGNPKLYAILKGWYIDGRSWREIASKEGYSERHIIRLHNIALTEVLKRRHIVSKKL